MPILLALFPLLANSSYPPLQPLLRINDEMHTTSFASDVHIAEGLLATASKDKTLRLWDLETGELLKVLRGPIGKGTEGQFIAVAISPDGKTVAAGGNTGYAWDRKKSVYLFNVESGDMIRRLTSLPAMVTQLDWSPDGEYIGVGLSTTHGIRIFNAETGDQVFEDRDYDGNTRSLEFDSSGRLLTSSKDQHLRLYNTRFELVLKTKIEGEGEPTAARFSPDGTLIAVGFTNLTKIEVRSGTDLSLLFKPEVDKIKGYLSETAWSVDGQTLFAGGWHRMNGYYSVAYWSDAGRTEPKFLPAFHYGIKALEGLPNDQLLIAAQDPGFGIIDKDGKWPVYKRSSLAYYDLHTQNLRVSEDGNIVRFGFYDTQPRTPGVMRFAEFNVRRAELTLDPKPLPDEKLIIQSRDIYEQQMCGEITPEESKSQMDSIFSAYLETHGYEKLGYPLPAPDPPGLVSPLTTASSFNVTDWKFKMNPKFNGEPLKTGASSYGRRLAIRPDESGFVLATQWEMIYYTKEGRKRWTIPTPDVNWGINIPPSNNHVIGIFGDGSIRWYDLKNGKELLGFLTDDDAERWVMWTPEGFFHGHNGGESMLGYHLNRGKSEAAKFIGIEQLSSIFQRTDLVTNKLGGMEMPIKEALREVGGIEGVLETGLPPELQLMGERFVTIENPNFDLEFQVIDSGGGIGRIEYRVNGKLVSNNDRQDTIDNNWLSSDGYIRHPFVFDSKRNRITVTAYNKQDTIASKRMRVHVTVASLPDEFFQELLEAFKSPEVQKLLNSPEVQELLKSPELQKLLMSSDPEEVLNSPEAQMLQELFESAIAKENLFQIEN